MRPPFRKAGQKTSRDITSVPSEDWLMDSTSNANPISTARDHKPAHTVI